MATKTALVAFGQGFEEIEALTIVDVLDRAHFKVTKADVSKIPLKGNAVTGAHNVEIKCDTPIESVKLQNFDVIAVPGGMPGATNCHESKALIQMLRSQKSNGRWYCAICASPGVVFGQNGLLHDVSAATCYPAPMFEAMFPKNTKLSKDRVVVDGKCITSQGPGTAMEFSLAIVANVMGEDKAKKLAKAMVVGN